MKTGYKHFGDLNSLKVIQCKIFLILSTICLFLPMKLEARIEIYMKPPKYELLGTAWTLWVEGKIEIGDAERLKKAIIENEIPVYSHIYLNSAGGSLFEGMEIGRVIRDYGLNTSVGFLDQNSETQTDGALCYSACTLAFVGGVFRWVNRAAEFGVHRFYSNSEFEDKEGLAQIVSAEILKYLSEMEIEDALFVISVEAGKNEIRILSAEELEATSIVNNGVGKARWEIKASNDLDSPFLYLRGERASQYGFHKFILGCNRRGNIFLHIVLDPQGRGQEIKASIAHTLSIDGDTYPYEDFQLGEIEIINGYVNAFYNLDKQTIALLKNANTVGMMYQQFSREAPVFLGFVGMSFVDARGLFSGLIKNCNLGRNNLNTENNQANPSAFRKISGIDFYGADITEKGVRPVSQFQCEQICSKNPECVSYSFIEEKNWCFPKHSVGKPIQNSKIQSGLRLSTLLDYTFTRVQGVDFLGDDIGPSGIKNVSLFECETLCLDSKNCEAYTYVRDKNWCFPKTGRGKVTENRTAVSGYK